MALDRITEEIAHFAGLLHLQAEAAKMRLDYEAFRTRNEQPALDPISGEPFSGKSDLAEKKSKVGHSAETVPEGAAPLLWSEVAPMSVLIRRDADQQVPPVDVGSAGSDQSLRDVVMAKSKMIDILPNSIVIAVTQTAYLSDDDLLTFDGSAVFSDQMRLEELEGLVQALSPIAGWSWSPGAGDVGGAAMQMAAALDSVAAADVAGAVSVLLRGDQADGTFIDGEAVDEAPALKDLMPAFLEFEEEQEAEPDPVQSDGVTDYDAGPFAVEPGHHVVSGGNRVINDTVLKSVWVDAPVIAVGEDVVRLDIISQVNIRIENAVLPGQMLPALSTSYNIAQMDQTSSVVDEGKGNTTEGDAGGLPSIWNVTRVEGDLVLMNWVQQHIFVSDQDRIEVKFTGAATYIGTGENLVFNESLILNLGFHYDLILIGGNFLTLNQITQVNVLLDQDRVTGDVPEGATLHAGDNLQVNTAAILTTGTDSLCEMTDDFEQALSDLADGAETLSASVAQDALFAGVSALNVLYIEGDLIQTSVIEQVNYLGDSDQIHFIKDMFSTADGAEVTVTSGSNAQINAATVIALGLDSKVMAGGDAYSDALIYQAELIDAYAPPTGVQIGGLANEAVAFLVDDMIEPTSSEDGGSGFHVPDSPGTADVMQTMLT